MCAERHRPLHPPTEGPSQHCMQVATLLRNTNTSTLQRNPAGNPARLHCWIVQSACVDARIHERRRR